ncbi:hypothetical protein Pint_00070 [Pistacia integerrima]|uniref:Uncharacterized protein n=1 Tax=Pistacia integerrima TaxID=434235 RepID=A0ACC0ZJ60_9ROSI|nr:hypothetical protein Pint_00070 [Pistacia integerrima]
MVPTSLFSVSPSPRNVASLNSKIPTSSLCGASLNWNSKSSQRSIIKLDDSKSSKCGASFNRLEMDGRLFEAARTGDVSLLHQLLLENPLILADCQLLSPHENLLHIATKARQLAFVQQLLNQSQISGREGRTCLHYAAINERVEIIDELLATCGECVKDVTSLGQTALHLALKYYKLDAFKHLVKWLEELGLEELVNMVDKDGNTILHLTISRKHLEASSSVELLLSSSILELNVRNSRGFTAMDLLDNTPMDNPNDVRPKQILQFAGALGTETPHNTLINNPNPSTGVSKD